MKKHDTLAIIGTTDFLSEIHASHVINRIVDHKTVDLKTINTSNANGLQQIAKNYCLANDVHHNINKLPQKQQVSECIIGDATLILFFWDGIDKNVLETIKTTCNKLHKTKEIHVHNYKSKMYLNILQFIKK